MPSNYNTITLASASASAVGVLGSAQQQTIDTLNTDWIAFQLKGTWVGQVNVQSSSDNGATWDNVATIRGSDGTLNSGATANGWWYGNTIGQLARLYVASYTSGTIQIAGGTTDVVNAPNGVNGGANSPSYVLPATSTSAYSVNLSASTNAASVKSSAGTLGEIDVSNNSGGIIYVKLYNKSSAPTVGTDSPILTIPIASAATSVIEFGQIGKRFTSGIAVAVTGAAADTDTTAIAAGAKLGMTYF